MEHCEFVKSPSIRDIFLMQKMYLQNQNSICQKITTYMNLCVFFWTVFLCMFNNYAVKIQHLVRDMNKTKILHNFFLSDLIGVSCDYKKKVLRHNIYMENFALTKTVDIIYNTVGFSCMWHCLFSSVKFMVLTAILKGEHFITQFQLDFWQEV